MDEYPGYYKTADAGYIDEDGYVFIMARTDDIINVAGHRLSTGGMEEVLAAHPDVAECAVIGVEDQLKGQLPLGWWCSTPVWSVSIQEIVKELVTLVRQKIGPVAAFKTAAVVKRLPKTRSGKILRGTMQAIADDRQWKMPATIDDPAILDEIAGLVERRGLREGRLTGHSCACAQRIVKPWRATAQEMNMSSNDKPEHLDEVAGGCVSRTQGREP